MCSAPFFYGKKGSKFYELTTFFISLLLYNHPQHIDVK